ncbi:MAG: SUF system Fe-S cluster assembly regulator [Pseudomonadota bacterium]
MLRMSKLTDYGTVVLAELAGETGTRTALALSDRTALPLPTVRKVLKRLARGGLVRSERGAGGGYELSRPADTISATEILTALEGPLLLTACSAEEHDCQLESTCSVGTTWQMINQQIRAALDSVTLHDLAAGPSPTPRFEHRLQPLAEINAANMRSNS